MRCIGPRAALLTQLLALPAVFMMAAASEPAEARNSSRKQRVPTVREVVANPRPQAVQARVAAAPTQPLLTVVSIAEQRVTVYGAGGSIVAQGPVSTGQEGHRTPTGVFSIIQKNRYHESNIYSGAPMPYMQRITWSGIAMHQGHLPGYPASHGCIRLPESLANQLWGMTKLGMRVIVAPRETSAAVFKSEKLPKPELLPSTMQTAAAGTDGTARVVVAAAGDTSVAASPRRLNPIERAQELRVAAVKAEAAAVQAARDALEAATLRSAEHREASAALRQAEAAVNIARLAVQGLSQTASGAGSTDDQNRDARAAALADLEDAEDRLAFAKVDEQERSDIAFDAARAVRETEAAAAAASEAVRAAGRRLEPLTVFVSRKEGRVFLRQGFMPVLDAPVAIRNPEEPIGTHVLVAMGAEHTGEVDWISASVPTALAGDPPPPPRSTSNRAAKQVVQYSAPAVTASARDALDRIELPAEVRREIAERIWLGASYIISDFGISNETGKGTDFIVLTR